MASNNQRQPTEEELLKRADDLLAEINAANADFVRKTDNLITSLDHGLDEAEKLWEVAETNLQQIEKEAVDKMDEAVLGFLSEDEEDTENTEN